MYFSILFCNRTILAADKQFLVTEPKRPLVTPLTQFLAICSRCTFTELPIREGRHASVELPAREERRTSAKSRAPNRGGRLDRETCQSTRCNAQRQPTIQTSRDRLPFAPWRSTGFVLVQNKILQIKIERGRGRKKIDQERAIGRPW